MGLTTRQKTKHQRGAEQAADGSWFATIDGVRQCNHKHRNAEGAGYCAEVTHRGRRLAPDVLEKLRDNIFDWEKKHGPQHY